MKKFLLLLIVAAAAGIGWYYLGQGAHQDGKAAAKGGFGGGPVAVEVMTLAPQTAQIIRQMPGRISASKVAEIRPQVGGIIIERLFDEGSQVEAGQSLYEIDRAPYEAAVALAEADLQKARASEQSVLVREKRLQALVKNNAVSKQEFDDVKADLAKARADIGIAQAALQQARINLQYTRVTAPISGQIGKSEITRGALVTMNQDQELARITQLDPVFVDMSISSAELLTIRPRLQNMQEIKVTLLLDNGIEYAHSGQLQFADVTVDETTGAVQIRAQFANPDQQLLPGMFVRARLSFNLNDALLVPQKAAQREAAGKLFVWVVADGKVQKQFIQVERTLGNQWLVTDGLTAGQQIVTAGMIKLKEDQQVTIDTAEKASKEQ